MMVVDGAVPLEGLDAITLAVLVGEEVLAPPWGAAAAFVTPITNRMLDSYFSLKMVYDLLEAINPATPLVELEPELPAVATAL